MIRLTVSMLFLIASCVTYANSIIHIDNSQHYNLNKQVDFLLDTSKKMTIQEVQDSDSWQPIVRNTINFGFTPEAVWLKFDVKPPVAMTIYCISLIPF